MKLTYDPDHNIAYIQFWEEDAEVDSIEVGDDVVVDIAPDGSVFGIELLDANKQLKIGDAGKLRLVNESTSDSVELLLT